MSLIYYLRNMIRKSHSWSLTWTRDKSADQSGPSIVCPSSGQSGPQAHSADSGCILPFEPRTSCQSRGSFSDLISRSTFPVSPSAPGWCFSRCGSSDVRIPFAIIPPPVRDNSRSFANVRDNSRYFHPPAPPSACGTPRLRRSIPPHASLGKLPNFPTDHQPLTPNY